MKFVLVNGRMPRPESFCALCCEAIGFKARAGIGALTFVVAAPFVSARGVTIWERVMKNIT